MESRNNSARPPRIRKILNNINPRKNPGRKYVIIIRSTWTGSIGVSLLSLPVRLASIIDDSSLTAHQYAPDGSRIRYKRVSEATGEEVGYSAIRRGYDASGGTLVFLTPAEIDSALGPVSRAARILMTTDAERVPDIAKAKPFLIQPGAGGERGYALLVRGLTATGKVAIVEIGIRQRKNVAVLSPTASGYLMLQMLEYADDIRKPDFPAPAASFSSDEEKLAITLIESLSQDFDHDALHDDSAVLLSELIERKAASGESTTADSTTESPVQQAEDLLAVLAASIEAARS